MCMRFLRKQCFSMRKQLVWLAKISVFFSVLNGARNGASFLTNLDQLYLYYPSSSTAANTPTLRLRLRAGCVASLLTMIEFYTTDAIRELTKPRRQRKLQRNVAFASELYIQKIPCFLFEFASLVSL